MTRDPMTGYWFVSWLNGFSTLPPDASSARAVLGVGGSFSTGDVKFTYKTVADPTWIIINDGSIGASGSGATTRANNDTKALFKLIHENIPDAWAPVSGGRGTSEDDFLASKTLTLPKALGRAFAVAGTGASLSARELGEFLGEEEHELTVAELAEHTHPAPGSLTFGTDVTGGAGVYLSADLTNNGTSGDTGEGEGHNTMQPTTFINAMIKL